MTVINKSVNREGCNLYRYILMTLCTFLGGDDYFLRSSKSLAVGSGTNFAVSALFSYHLPPWRHLKTL
jgi:hypothetical protein